MLLQCAGAEAGSTGKSLTFMVTDGVITDDGILEDINNLLNSGEVPNIFPEDEQQTLLKDLKELLEEKTGIEMSEAEI